MISVVIPAHDEAGYLGRTLTALGARAPFETIVVANGCTDATAGIGRAHGATVVETREAGVSRARNLGARVATGDVLVFLDADTVLDRHGLDTIAAVVPVRADYGTCRIRPDHPGWRATATTALLALGHRIAGTSLGVLFCARTLFESAGGFDPRLVAGEDNDLNARFARLGARRVYLGDVDAFTSMRRFERLGYLRTQLAWLAGYVHPPDTYQVVR
jgi:glycosyltransferase involved in cell wall biosynthesis